MSLPTISAAELSALRAGGKPLELIDVRTPAEFREVHAEGARSIPLDRLDPGAIIASRGDRAGEPLYVLCQTGGRARKACEQFAAAGYPNAVVVEGGTLAWERAGLPVVRGRKAMSLERQVHVAAGALVLLGTALGAFLHPGFLAIPAFIGGGLVFAGITDTCAMAMLLARMPWNQMKDSPGGVPPIAGACETGAKTCCPDGGARW
jgi:rhodanese-related sulfurtransferase